MTPADGPIQSIRQRLINLAHDSGEETQAVLTRYGIERLLYRLSVSPYRDQYVLKGAMLFRLWSETLHRPTTDLDMLCLEPDDAPRLESVFRDVCAVAAEEDALSFDAESIRSAPIREGEPNEGLRVRLMAHLGMARIPLQVDVGFGDAIVSAPRVVEYPTMLGFRPPRLRVYPMESVVAEKYQAMAALGMTNSRLKDFYDVWALSQSESFDGHTLTEAIAATFAARRTPLPVAEPISFTGEFHGDPHRQAAWGAFLRRSHLEDGAKSLPDTVLALRTFRTPPTSALLQSKPYDRVWPPQGPLRDG